MKILVDYSKKSIKLILRKLGLLKSVRRFLYYKSKSKLIRKLRRLKNFEYSILNKRVIFSIDDPFSASFISHYLLNKTYEPLAIDLLNKYLNPTDIFVDVGANIGYFSVIMSVGKPGLKVYAFEMSKENYTILLKNIRLNSLNDVEAYQLAVSNYSGTLYHINTAVGSAVLKIIEENHNQNPDLICVNAVSLDDFFRLKSTKPTFVKIDVEGAELKVLQGMKNLLSGRIKLLIEIHPKELSEFGSSREDVLNYLKHFGFLMQSYFENDKKNELLFAWK